MKFKYWVPFLFFIIPTTIITYFTWPSEVWKPYPGKELFSIVGLGVMFFFMATTYWSGLRHVLKDKKDE